MELTPIASQMTLVEKYRPQSIEDCILPKELKAKLLSYVKTGKFPHLLLVGSPGVGKTTVAKALARELEADYLYLNASKDASIDALRTTIQQFAGTVSMVGNGRKIVHLDEADYASHHFQPALRAFIEDYSSNCVFILTANYPNKILSALRDSRFAVIEFKIPKEEKASLQAETFARVQRILNIEGISYDKEVIATLIKRYFPDIRRILTEIDGEMSSGHIGTGMLSSSSEEDWTELYKALKAKQFSEVRKWVGMHSDVEPQYFFRKLFVDLTPKLTDDTAPLLVLLIAKYQYQAAFVADVEINNVACLVEVMAECLWK